MMKKGIKIAAICLASAIGLVILTAAAYLLYVVIQYDRIDDNLSLTVENPADELVTTDRTYSIMTYNIGFGAYGPDYSFFMDSGVMLDGRKVKGKYGKGISKQSVADNTDGSIGTVRNADCDFVFLQEADENADRSYHINQRKAVQSLDGYTSVYAENYHSAYLFYPFNDPHGKTNAGLVSLSKYKIESSIRRSFPISTSFSKFLDLDRCFSVTYLPIEGKSEKLVLIHQHMSAYDKGGEFRAKQLAMLNDVLKEEYEKGNYVVAGGDFNHDIAASKSLWPSRQQMPTWIYDITDDDLPDGFRIAAATNAPTCRSAEIPYEKGVNHTVVVDGFIVSDNVAVASVENKDMEFLYSDHNPVLMKFALKP